MSAPSGSDSFQNESPVLVDDLHVFHPLSVFESQLLSGDLDLSFSEDNNPPAVLLDDCIYVRDDHLSFRATEGQLWKYSLISKSLDFIPTPEGVVRYYGLAVWSKKLVLVGGQSKDFGKSSFNVWVRQGTKWSSEIIKPVPVESLGELLGPNGIILSAAGHEDLLFAVYGYQLNDTRIALFCYDAITGCWRQPSICHQNIMQYVDKFNLLVHSASLYLMIQLHNTKSRFLYAPISLSAEVPEFQPFFDVFISGRARFITIGNEMIVAVRDGQKIKLYTIFKDDKNFSLVDIDELNLEYESIFSIIGFKRSLLIIGREDSKSVTTIRKFESKVSPYNPNGHFTIKAIKKLERAANIPVLTDEGLKSNLGDIKTYCGFKLHQCPDICQSVVIKYMHSWLVEYQHNASTTKPTWSKFLEALKFVGLSKLEKQVRECLESAPKPEHCELKEVVVTGIEELQKTEAKLKLLHGRLNSEADSQQIKKDVDWCYRQCCTASSKIRQEQLTFKSNNDQLAKEKDQLVKEKEQLAEENGQLKQESHKHKEEIDSLQRELAERDQLPAKRRRLDGEELLAEMVTVRKLRLLKHLDKDRKEAKIDVINKASHMWKKITDLLTNDHNKASTVQKRSQDPCECLRQVLIECFISNSPDYYSQDWKGFIQLLHDADCEVLARDVEYAILNAINM